VVLKVNLVSFSPVDLHVRAVEGERGQAVPRLACSARLDLSGPRARKRLAFPSQAL
jgi:hypothetical protein